jgi:hypothetical protein
MPMRTLFIAFVAASLLAGCAIIQPRVQKTANKLECDGSKDCAVAVSVDCPRYFECDLSVDYDVVVVLGQNRPVDIRWKLSGARQVEFADNGIRFDNSVFECKREGADVYVCRDKHPDFGVYKYGISVTIKDSPFGPRGVQSLDPWVINR